MAGQPALTYLAGRPAILKEINMEVKLYKRFPKRMNSTVNPDTYIGPAIEGHIMNLKLKANFGYENQNQSIKCDKLHPSFFLTGDNDWVYLKAWDMYYFITKVDYDINGAQYIECLIDVLGTWRDEIFATRAFVTYSTKVFNKYLKDSRVAPTADIEVEVFSDNNTDILSDSEIYYILTVLEITEGDINNGAIVSYYLDQVQLDLLVAKIINDGNNFFGALGLTITDALQAIKGLRLCPFVKSALPHRADREIYLGKFATGVTATPLEREFYAENDGIPYTLYDDFRDLEPYSSAKVFLPMVGIVNIPMNKLIGGAHSLGYRYYVNVETGKIMYILFRRQSSPGASASDIIGTYSGDFTFEIPLGVNVISNPVGAAVTSLGAGAALVGEAIATGGAAVALEGVLAGASVTSAGIAAATFFTSNDIIGTFSGNYGWGACKYIKLEITHHKVNVDPENLRPLYGRECREVHLISDLYEEGEGCYCRTDGFSINIAALNEVREMINAAMDNGVYLE